MIKRTATAALLATLPVLAEPEVAAESVSVPAVQAQPADPAPVVEEQPAATAPAPAPAVEEQPAAAAPAPAPAVEEQPAATAPAPAPAVEEQPAAAAPAPAPAVEEQPAAAAPAPAPAVEEQPAAPAPAVEEQPAAAAPAPAPAVEEQPAAAAPAPAPAVEEQPAATAPAPAPAVEEQPAAAAPAPAQGVEAAYRSIVKIEVAIRQPDYATPWQSGRFGGGNGTGFMVQPGLFMTNAHVVANAERITISPYGDARKYPAKVKYVAHDADLALVEVTENLEAFQDIPCLQFSDNLPCLEDQVRAVGYPIGGSRLSVTRGIVSRIDTTLYSHSQSESHLTVQIDAAINPGNSGGPVLMDDKVVGVAFQGLMQANSTGYMIPMPVIKRFLKDVEDGHYDSYVDLAVNFFPLSNPAMRKHYGLAENSPGVLVGEVSKGGSCDGVLKPGDVLVAINDLPVDQSAMIELDGERVMLEELAERSFKGDKLRMRVLRDGKEMELEVELKPLECHTIMAQEYDKMPRYVQFAGLVFQPLHRNVIAAHQLNTLALSVSIRDYLNRGASLDKPDMVILTKVLKDEVNARYSAYGSRMVTKVNGVEVKGMEHLYSLLYPEDGVRPDYTVIEFSDSPRPLVIDNKMIDAANERIKARYGVPVNARLK